MIYHKMWFGTKQSKSLENRLFFKEHAFVFMFLFFVLLIYSEGFFPSKKKVTRI